MAVSARKTILARQPIGIQTRFANDIPNEFNPTPPHEQDVTTCKALITSYPKAETRTREPSYGYNCHGLTFAARRTQVVSSVDVQYILSEDGYVSVPMAQALPGDIVIYQSQESGEYEHSGIVVERKASLMGPKIVSKWGASQEFIHYYADCPYMPSNVTFYRMPK
jgi:cell wall-associated NlpC family hydrolase